MSENLPVDKSDSSLETKEASSKTKKAFFLGAVGAITLVTSFALTYFLSHHDRSFTFALYGLTMIGITMVFGSLVMFFE